MCLTRRLHSRNSRTLLLFVIRDHIGTTPLANLEATLTADIQKIWESLSKPTELKDRQLSDYFDLSFAALPHKVLAADKFELEIQELRRRFVDKSRDDYVFKPSYHKRIPADGVAFYMDGIWVSVVRVNYLYRAIHSLENMCRNKSRRTRILICRLNKNFLLSSDATRFPPRL